MSGKILIVDELATNRIVLKVKLSAAFYDVHQAASGTEALAAVTRIKPDLILASSELSDIGVDEFVTRLRQSGLSDSVPVVMVLGQDTPRDRISALRAGASDILSKPVDETFLLARLRSLLRQYHSNHDLRVHSGKVRALGFAEAQQGFARPGRVAVLAADKSEAKRLSTALSPVTLHHLTAMLPEELDITGSDRSDIFLVKFSADQIDHGMRMIAKLRAAPSARNCPIIALLPREAHNLAPTILDMGAIDAVADQIAPEEIVLRMSTQLEFKKSADQMRDQLQIGLQAAVSDPLTGLYNRRYALPYLERLTRLTHADKRSFAVMVADLDHFKRVNDRYGHAAGDAVLARIAGILRSNLNEEDVVARIGGEEFLIVIPDTCGENAHETANRLCRLIRKSPISIPGCDTPIHVTISIGVAMGHCGQNGQQLCVDTLLDEADRALYGSKADGRNTVTLSGRTAA